MFSAKFRNAYLRAVGIDRNDKKTLRRAYETAHRIREFEIELYWKRTTYIWAMQAALVGIAMFLHTGGTTTITLGLQGMVISTSPSGSSLLAILLVSTLALVIACLWSAMIKGAKFWHNNWDRHVDILGQHLGENLYQVYPIDGWDGRRPFSVTRINSRVVWAFICFWVSNVGWAVCALFALEQSQQPTWLKEGISFAANHFDLCVGILVAISSLIVAVLVYNFGSLRMEYLGEEIDETKQDGKHDALLVRTQKNDPSS